MAVRMVTPAALSASRGGARGDNSYSLTSMSGICSPPGTTAWGRPTPFSIARRRLISALTPGHGVFKRMRCPQQRAVLPMPSYQHQAYRQAIDHPTGHVQRRVAGDVERRRIGNHLEGPGNVLFTTGIGRG